VQQSYARGVVFVILAVVGWSLSGLFVRLVPGLDGWQINCWRGYTMAVALAIYLVALYGPETGARFRAIPLPGLIGAAGFFVMGSTLYVTSLTLAGTATVAVIGALSPIFTGLLSPWLTHERASLAAWISAGMALVGVAVMAWDGVTAGNILGIAVSLLVPLCFAGQTLMLRRYREFDMMPAICLGGFAVFAIAGLASGFAVPLAYLPILLLMGPIQLGIPLIFYGKGARSVPAVTLSLIAMLDVVLNPFWTWIGVGERPALSAYVGGAIIVAAVLLVIAGERALALLSRKPGRESA
jgi:drug/metabolite transporter, DME family